MQGERSGFNGELFVKRNLTNFAVQRENGIAEGSDVPEGDDDHQNRGKSINAIEGRSVKYLTNVIFPR